MYNFKNQKIPVFLPVQEGGQLQPWFSMEDLDAGLALIRNNQIEGFYCIRNTVGALINQETPVALQFDISTQLHQGFMIQNRRCGLCSLKHNDKACKHLAALAILSLILPPGKIKPLPIPIAFSNSNWRQIGDFLLEWFQRKKYSLHCLEHGVTTDCEIKLAGGKVRMTIPHSWLLQGGQFLSGTSGVDLPEKSRDGLESLREQIKLWSMSDGEKQLAEAGTTSQGWRKENSLAYWLVRMLFTLYSDQLPQLEKAAKGSDFILHMGMKQDPCRLEITLSKEKAWDLVRKVSFNSGPARILLSAKECYKVQFNAENSLEVIPCLRLRDGRILGRQELSNNRLSGAYYLDGEGFLPTTRLPREGMILELTDETTALPLMGFLKNEEKKDRSFTIPPNDIGEFIEQNREALEFPDNIIDPNISQLQIRDFPDRLVIESFEEHEDWCYLSCHYGLGNTSITLQEIYEAKEQKMACLPGKEWLQLEGTQLSWLYDLIGDRLENSNTNKLRLTHQEMIALTAIMPDVEIQLKEKSLRQKLNNIIDVTRWSEDTTSTNVPEHLRPYQRNGVAWLTRLFKMGIGGLLADDMGLGKTHQGLALLQAAAHQDEKKLTLVICPASVVLNWAEKIDSFFQGLDYGVYYGPNRDLESLQSRTVIITSYGVVRQDLQQLQDCFFDIVLLDEIQQLKNRSTNIHRAVASLDSRVKIGLTGTPIENSLQDLRSLFDICLPGLLGTEKQFDQLYAKPITTTNNPEARKRLSQLINPFILRRNKKQVLTELPEIIEDDRICQLSDDQISLYREIIQEKNQELEELESGTGGIPYMNILATITRLKRLCCHPCLLQNCDDTLTYRSGKWDLFVELAEELFASEMKFVIFSQYTGMIKLFEKYLQEKGIHYSSLTGDMAAPKRQEMIENFNSNPDCRVFCASLLAGGVGIDLTSAQAVIHYDRWWNPAREEQATGRVHRMGQKNVVQVFRLITKGTLEEKIHMLINKKRELATSLIHEDEGGIIKQMNRRQLAELFQFAPGLRGK